VVTVARAFALAIATVASSRVPRAPRGRVGRGLNRLMPGAAGARAVLMFINLVQDQGSKTVVPHAARRADGPSTWTALQCESSLFLWWYYAGGLRAACA